MTFRIAPVALAAFIFSLASCHGQQDDNNKSWKVSFEKKYPDAKEVDWREDSHGNKEAHFEMDGEKYRADFDTDGNWVETEQNVDYDDLPDAVQAVIKKEYDKDDITEIEWVDHHSKGEFYDIEFKKKGKNKDVELREDGSRL